jgi:hypothetical protein
MVDQSACGKTGGEEGGLGRKWEEKFVGFNGLRVAEDGAFPENNID